MAETRTIKKYGNRRLYCTLESRYVNLAEVAAMLRDGQEVQVVDAKSGADLTRQVLTQIIIEDSRHDDGPPLDFLRQLVRTTDQANKDFLQWYLGHATEAFKKIQDTVGPRLKLPTIEEQRKTWSRLLDPFGVVRSFTATGAKSDTSIDPEGVDTAHRPQRKAAAPAEAESVVDPSEESNTTEQLASLRRRLEELEDRLGSS